MEKISLYIADKKVDLDDKSLILFNYTMEDLSNPTAVKNSFSKQVTLKGTPANNAIFGHLFKSDRKTMYGVSHSGVFFDPMRKTPFAIYSERGDVLESGYVKVDSMTNTNGKIEYKVTLYGGLGSFLYGLTYDAEGNKRTLADLKKWKHYNGEEKGLVGFRLDKDTLVNKAWAYIREGNTYLKNHPSEAWDIINFAPCYNGLPEDFDSNKILVNGLLEPFSSQTEKNEDGVQYGRKQGCSTILVTMSQMHTEWEVRNIMPSLQRPVIRLRAILDAIFIEAKEQGYNVLLDDWFFKSSNKVLESTYVTMPILKRVRNSNNAVPSILQSSLTPCDYLLSFIKTCGLVIICEGNKIEITSMRRFYGITNSVDLTDKIDVSSIQIKPILASHKIYEMKGNKIIGKDASDYEKSYGLPYGCQRINTGYEFDAESKDITKDIAFIGAADVAERNYTNAEYYLNVKILGISILQLYHPIGMYEEVKYQLFGVQNDEQKSKDFVYYFPPISALQFSQNSYVDWLPKVQMHGDENKMEQGEHCLLFLEGSKHTPWVQIDSEKGNYLTYYVSDDHPDIDALNAGISCWNLDVNSVIQIQELPSFRRTSGQYSLDWGHPIERYTDESINALSLYDRYWKSYLSDRYNADTKVMTCKVYMSGLRIRKKLMSTKFFFDNAIWTLNKINNYSLTTDGLTECEFIKVNDWNKISTQTI